MKGFESSVGTATNSRRKYSEAVYKNTLADPRSLSSLSEWRAKRRSRYSTDFDDDDDDDDDDNVESMNESKARSSLNSGRISSSHELSHDELAVDHGDHVMYKSEITKSLSRYDSLSNRNSEYFEHLPKKVDSKYMDFSIDEDEW